MAYFIDGREESSNFLYTNEDLVKLKSFLNPKQNSLIKDTENDLLIDLYSYYEEAYVLNNELQILDTKNADFDIKYRDYETKILDIKNKINGNEELLKLTYELLGKRIDNIEELKLIFPFLELNIKNKKEENNTNDQLSLLHKIEYYYQLKNTQFILLISYANIAKKIEEIEEIQKNQGSVPTSLLNQKLLFEKLLTAYKDLTEKMKEKSYSYGQKISNNTKLGKQITRELLLQVTTRESTSNLPLDIKNRVKQFTVDLAFLKMKAETNSSYGYSSDTQSKYDYFLSDLDLFYLGKQLIRLKTDDIESLETLYLNKLSHQPLPSWDKQLKKYAQFEETLIQNIRENGKLEIDTKIKYEVSKTDCLFPFIYKLVIQEFELKKDFESIEEFEPAKLPVPQISLSSQIPSAKPIELNEFDNKTPVNQKDNNSSKIVDTILFPNVELKDKKQDNQPILPKQMLQLNK